MTRALKTISPTDYLARERTADSKSEYFQGEVFAMAGGSANHSLIAANFIGEARQALKAKPCDVYSSDLRVKIQASGLYTYPDATIVCGELQFEDDAGDTLLNPTLVVEVLSDSTEQYDRGRKSNHYRQISSLREIVLISQETTHVECFVRQKADGWLMTEQKLPTGSVTLQSLSISLDMTEIYRNVAFKKKT